jgi:hypothetical protein
VTRHREDELFGGYWWRADAYEIWRGYVAPQKGASFARYDPWSLALDDVLALLVAVEKTDEDDDDAVLRLVDHVGLLGLGLLNVVEIAAHLRVFDKQPGAMSPRVERTIARRSLLGWIKEHEPCGRAQADVNDPAKRRSDAGAQVTVLDPLRGGVRPSLPYDVFLGRWLPRAGRAAATDVLTPATVAFWRAYAEPVFQVRRRASSLVHALQTLVNPSPGSVSTAKALEVFRELEGDARRRTTLTEAGLRSRWNTSTLISALAVRLSEEELERGRLRRCACQCRRLFFAEHSNRHFFDEKCRNLNRQRRYRMKPDAVPVHPHDEGRSAHSAAQAAKKRAKERRGRGKS